MSRVGDRLILSVAVSKSRSEWAVRVTSNARRETGRTERAMPSRLGRGKMATTKISSKQTHQQVAGLPYTPSGLRPPRSSHEY